MFGKPKRFGFGPFGGSNGIVATPEQEAESARLASMFGMGGTPEDAAPQMQQPSLEGAFGIGGKIMPQQQAAPKRGGLFGNLGKIGGAMSGIGDVLDDSESGMKARELDYRQQQDRSRAFAAQQQAEAENAQWYKREQWKRDNAPAGDTIDLREDNAGNVWQFDKRTGQPISDKPVWVDKTPKEFVHEGMRYSIRNPYGTGDAPDLDGTPVSEDGHVYTPGPGGRANPANWKPEGGAGSNASGGFREAFAEWN